MFWSGDLLHCDEGSTVVAEILYLQVLEIRQIDKKANRDTSSQRKILT